MDYDLNFFGGCYCLIYHNGEVDKFTDKTFQLLRTWKVWEAIKMPLVNYSSILSDRYLLSSFTVLRFVKQLDIWFSKNAWNNLSTIGKWIMSWLHAYATLTIRVFSINSRVSFHAFQMKAKNMKLFPIEFRKEAKNGMVILNYTMFSEMSHTHQISLIHDNPARKNS